MSKTNDLSLTTLRAIACFLAAAHQTMLETLREACRNGLNGPQLLEYWHGLMEPTGTHDHREAFFTKVVQRADSVTGRHFIFFRLDAFIIFADEVAGVNLPKKSYQRERGQADTL